MFVPTLLVSAAIWSFGKLQLKAIENNYGIQNAESLNLTNSVQLLDQYTQPDFSDMIQVADRTPDRFMEQEYQDSCNNALKEKSSYLVVRRTKRLFIMDIKITNSYLKFYRIFMNRMGISAQAPTSTVPFRY
jgi:hypothetical protein